MLLRLTAPRQKKKNCKYRRQFRKSVQALYAKVVCPTFWDRPPSEAVFSPGVFFDYSDAIIEVRESPRSISERGRMSFLWILLFYIKYFLLQVTQYILLCQ